MRISAVTRSGRIDKEKRGRGGEGERERKRETVHREHGPPFFDSGPHPLPREFVT